MLLCANTMHVIADKVQAVINIPLLHIADVVLKAVEDKNVENVLLLGTKYTMQNSFYADRSQKNGIEIVIPNQEDV